MGSDPYLAPEVYDGHKYDPQPTDIWSLAIIFACMSLRRFPWKAPRLTDNSFKLFVSTPTPGTPSSDAISVRTSEDRSRSTVDVASAAENAHQSSGPSVSTDGQDTSSEQHGQRHQRHRHQEPGSAGQNLVPPTSVERQVSNPPLKTGPPKPEVIKGPWRLLRLLPRESRTIIGRMLDVNPKRRATLEEMMSDPWISNSPVCSQMEEGKVIRAPGHEHTLEPGNTTQPAES